VPVAVLPALSVAEHDTVLFPVEKVEPEGGVQDSVPSPDSESEALALYDTAAPLELLGSTTMLCGKFRVGAVRSILTVTDAELERPAPLVTEHVSVVPCCPVSVVRVVLLQPLDEAIPDSGSETDHVTVTGPLFQPLLLALGVTVDVITGGVVSARAKRAVIVPVPCIVAVVDEDVELVKVIDATSPLQDEKA
jgi:hypothetical protein